MNIDKYFHLYSREDDIVFEEIEKPKLRRKGKWIYHIDDLRVSATETISRQAAIGALQKEIDKGIPPFDDAIGLMRQGVILARDIIERLPPAQFEVAKDTNVPANDCISRQAAIDVIEAGRLTKLIDAETAVNGLKALLSAQPEPQWIPFVLRPATNEEKEENPDLDYYLDGKLPKNGQKILITVRVSGHEEVQSDEFYSDFDGSYLDGQYEIGTEAVAWMPLPKPYKEGDE